MLNISKKKLVNRYIKISIIFFVLFFCYNFAFCKDFYNQGQFIDYHLLSKIRANMDRVDVAGEFGKPNIVLSYDVNCWCYCYHERVGNVDRIVYLYFAFNYDGGLIDVRYLRLYDHGDYKYKKIPLL
ncbi:MAG TPA: outer membrane protein assembly factor BamE domain-containing protein [Candidatus Azoamicus sp.]